MDAFGAENANYITIQYPFVDIYGNNRFIDFALECEGEKIAIEIDVETYHNPNKVSKNKQYYDLLKQNSLIHNNWKVYKWGHKNLKEQQEKVKDELVIFLGDIPMFMRMEGFFPKQKGKAIILKDHQQEKLVRP